MIDLHCHILPGLDDGARDMDEALAMAAIAAADGIRRIVATPHVTSGGPAADTIAAAAAELNARLQDRSVALEILPGAELAASAERADMPAHTLNRSDYLLLELPHTHLPANFSELLFRLQLAGLRPVLSHPERNPAVLRDPNRMLDLVAAGVCCQITAGSLCGAHGPDAQACAAHLLRRGAVHCIASDAHEATRRRPVLSEGRRAAERIVGEARARKLVVDNPAAIIEGRDLTEAA